MSISEDSKTDLFVSRVDNAANLRAALTAGMGGFYLTGTNAVPFIGATFTAGAEFEYCSRNAAGALRKSPTFRPEQVFNATYSATTARTEQVTYLGYNGTAGSMDAANSTYYGLKVILNHTFGMLNNSPQILTIPYKSDATATQREVAAGIANAATSWLKRQAYRPFTAVRINSGAQANAIAAATVAVTNGSKAIVTSDDETLILLNGTIVRLGVSGAGTAACYVIESQDAGAGAARIYYLDQEYQGATAAAYAAATFETVTEGNWGIQFTGVSPTDAEFNPVTDEPFVVSFTLEAGDFTTAAVTYTTAPFIGRGTYQLVSYKEAYTQFQDKGRHVSVYPPTVRNIVAQSGDTFGTFSFDVFKQDYIDPVTGQRPVSKLRIQLAVLTGIGDIAKYIVDLGASLGCGAILTADQAI